MFTILKRFRQYIAIFFLTCFLNQLSIPIVYALTAGPTSPEATSFEPVDTTDMVSMLSGDFTYNTPILEVPGPSGGYPLSLSYHAGIQPDLEASWVGLGWTLNPGAINRMVNGYPDDFFGNQQITNHVYWSGGTTTTYSVGVSIGLPYVSVGGGLTFAQDTYKGFGMGGYVSGGAGASGGGVSFGVNATVGISPYGGTYASAGIGLSGGGVNATAGISPNGGTYASAGIGLSVGLATIQGGTLSASLGVEISSNGGVGVGGGLTMNETGHGYERPLTHKLLGFSINSQGKPSISSVGGISASIHSNKSGNISSGIIGINVEIPVFPGINISLGWSKTRYWIDNYENISIYGTLHQPLQNTTTNGYYKDKTFDNHDLRDIEEPLDSKRPTYNQLGGTFPSYDTYNVVAQGVSGSMKPYHYKKNLLRQEISENSNYKVYQNTAFDDLPPTKTQFRFENDFSSSYHYNPQLMDKLDWSKYNFNTENMPFNFEQGLNTNGWYTNRLIGSKHIEWFTNEEMSGNQHFGKVLDVSPQTKGFDRHVTVGRFSHKRYKNIGAFAITNESGVTFHFSLPVYSYDEYARSESNEKGVSYNEQFKNDEYAYTWLLTAVTGPDYVDRSENGTSNGIADEHDWGYWVRFDYGKWADSYKWRNPAEGFNKDIDDDVKSYSSGKKEVYYLNSISTTTHTALFVKSIRADGKGLAQNGKNSSFELKEVGTNICIDNNYYNCIHNCAVEHENRTEQFRNCLINNTQQYCESQPYGIEASFYEFDRCYNDCHCTSEAKETRYDYPTSSLKLDKILLFNNKDLNQSFESIGTQYNHNLKSHIEGVHYRGNRIQKIHYGENVLDIFDLTDNTLINKALRVVNFNFDYSLCQGTPNSFDAEGQIYTRDNNDIASPNLNAQSQKLGKLTLLSLSVGGLGNQILTPPIKFYYDVENQVSKPYLLKADKDFEEYENLTCTEDQAGSAYCYGNGTFTKQYFLQYAYFELNSNQTSFEEGTLLEISTQGKKYFAFADVLTNKDGVPIQKISANFSLHNLFPAVNNDFQDVSVEIKPTKNPSYMKDHLDIWGMYKADYIPKPNANGADNKNLSGSVSDYSSKNTDVWSLRRIETNLGANIFINYESDSYEKIAFDQPILYALKGDAELLSNQIKIALEDYTAIACLPSQGTCNLLSIIWHDYHYSDKMSLPFEGFEVQNKEFKEASYTKNADGTITLSHPEIGTAFSTKPDRDCIENDLNCGEERVKYTSPKLKGGYLVVKDGNICNKKGGGLRVASLSVKNPMDNSLSTTHYEYAQGTTSYEPINFYKEYLKGVVANETAWKVILNKFNSQVSLELNEGFKKILAWANYAPAPGVMYGKVTVKESRTQSGSTQAVFLPNYSVYEFQVFEEKMIQYQTKSSKNTQYFHNYGNNLWRLVNSNKISAQNVSVLDYTSQIGSLKSISLFDKEHKLLSTTKNTFVFDFINEESNYKQKLNDINHQGVVQELYTNARIYYPNTLLDTVVNTNTVGYAVFSGKVQSHLMLVSSRYSTYPSVQLSTENINYKTGIRSVTENLAFDPVSGVVTKSLYTDSQGDKVLSVSKPAYTVYPEMGSKALNPTNKNMLTQTASSYSFLGDTEDYSKVLSASAETWAKNWQYRALMNGAYSLQSENELTRQIWRKQATYTPETKTANPDGTFSITPFDFTNISSNNGWQKTAEITLYDRYSHALEAQDINGMYAATKLNAQQTMVYASASNARYTNFAYSGAEDTPIQGYFGGEVLAPANSGNVSISTEAAHTGIKSIKILAGGGSAFEYKIIREVLQSPRYEASVWVKANSVADLQKVKIKVDFGSQGGVIWSSANPTLKAGDWYLVKLQVEGNDTQSTYPIDVSCIYENGGTSPIYLDDFRVHPLEAGMSSYVYDAHTGLVRFILDGQNMYVEYEYDEIGRLKAVYQETFKFGKVKTATHEIKYRGQN